MPVKPIETKSVDEVIEDLRQMVELAENPAIQTGCQQFLGWNEEKFHEEFDQAVVNPLRNMHSMMTRAWGESTRTRPKKTEGEASQEDKAYQRFRYELGNRGREGFRGRFRALFSESTCQKLDRKLKLLETELSERALHIEARGLSAAELDQAIHTKASAKGTLSDAEQDKLMGQVMTRASVRNAKVYDALDAVVSLRESLAQIKILTDRRNDTAIAAVEDALNELREMLPDGRH